MKVEIDEVLEKLDWLYNESVRLYEANGRAAFESGRIDGVKWAIEIIRGFEK